MGDYGRNAHRLFTTNSFAGLETGQNLLAAFLAGGIDQLPPGMRSSPRLMRDFLRSAAEQTDAPYSKLPLVVGVDDEGMVEFEMTDQDVADYVNLLNPDELQRLRDRLPALFGAPPVPLLPPLPPPLPPSRVPPPGKMDPCQYLINRADPNKFIQIGDRTYNIIQRIEQLPDGPRTIYFDGAQIKLMLERECKIVFPVQTRVPRDPCEYFMLLRDENGMYSYGTEQYQIVTLGQPNKLNIPEISRMLLNCEHVPERVKLNAIQDFRFYAPARDLFKDYHRVVDDTLSAGDNTQLFLQDATETYDAFKAEHPDAQSGDFDKYFNEIMPSVARSVNELETLKERCVKELKRYYVDVLFYGYIMGSPDMGFTDRITIGDDVYVLRFGKVQYQALDGTIGDIPDDKFDSIYKTMKGPTTVRDVVDQANTFVKVSTTFARFFNIELENIRAGLNQQALINKGVDVTNLEILTSLIATLRDKLNQNVTMEVDIGQIQRDAKVQAEMNVARVLDDLRNGRPIMLNTDSQNLTSMLTEIIRTYNVGKTVTPDELNLIQAFRNELQLPPGTPIQEVYFRTWFELRRKFPDANSLNDVLYAMNLYFIDALRDPKATEFISENTVRRINEAYTKYAASLKQDTFTDLYTFLLVRFPNVSRANTPEAIVEAVYTSVRNEIEKKCTDDLTTQQQEHQQEIDELVRSSTAVVQKLQAELEALKHTTVPPAPQQRIDELEAEVKRLKSELAARAEVEQMEVETAVENQAEIVQLRDKVAAAKDQVEQLTGAMQKLQLDKNAEITRLEGELAACQQRGRELDALVKAGNAEHADALAAETAKEADLQRRLDACKNELALEKMNQEGLLNQANKASETQQKLIDDARAENEKISNELIKLREAYAALDVSFDENQEEMEDLREQLNKCLEGADTTELKARLEQKEREFGELQRKYDAIYALVEATPPSAPRSELLGAIRERQATPSSRPLKVTLQSRTTAAGEEQFAFGAETTAAPRPTTPFQEEMIARAAAVRRAVQPETVEDVTVDEDLGELRKLTAFDIQNMSQTQLFEILNDTRYRSWILDGLLSLEQKQGGDRTLAQIDEDLRKLQNKYNFNDADFRGLKTWVYKAVIQLNSE